MDLKICPDGTRAPVPIGECCPSLKACKTNITTVKRMLSHRFLGVPFFNLYFSSVLITGNCKNVACSMDLKVCPDGEPAPVPAGECCPALKACKPGLECAFVTCILDMKICPDGTPAPVPVGGCCPSLDACPIDIRPVQCMSSNRFLNILLNSLYFSSIAVVTNCTNTFCTMDLKICPDGTPAPIPVGECCPSLKACKTNVDCTTVPCPKILMICPDGTPAPIPVGECCPSLTACKTKVDCTHVACTMDLKICPDGTPAPVPVGECCPSLKACKSIVDCSDVACTLDMKICPDGTPAPVPVGECCPSYKACKAAGNHF